MNHTFGHDCFDASTLNYCSERNEWEHIDNTGFVNQVFDAS